MAENQQNSGGSTPPQHPAPLPAGGQQTAAAPGAAGGRQQQQQDPAALLASTMGGKGDKGEKPAADAGAAAPQQQPTGQQAAAAAATPPPDGYVRAADVQQLVKEQLAEAMKGYRETKAADDARASFQTLKMGDLPEVYRNQLGTDPGQWAKQEQQIRQQYRADFKASGGTVPDVGGGRTGGVPASQVAAAPKVSDNSPVAMLAAGLAEAGGKRE